MISPGQCPVCKFDGIVESDELEWEDEQIIDFRCAMCDELWRVKVMMQAVILPHWRRGDKRKFSRGQWVKYKDPKCVDTPHKVLGYTDDSKAPDMVCLEDPDGGADGFVFEDEIELVAEKPCSVAGRSEEE